MAMVAFNGSHRDPTCWEVMPLQPARHNMPAKEQSTNDNKAIAAPAQHPNNADDNADLQNIDSDAARDNTTPAKRTVAVHNRRLLDSRDDD
eukprot:349627-Chlamydomonas_euryale.AAC.3